jgi:hypothetical protein
MSKKNLLVDLDTVTRDLESERDQKREAATKKLHAEKELKVESETR